MRIWCQYCGFDADPRADVDGHTPCLSGRLSDCRGSRASRSPARSDWRATSVARRVGVTYYMLHAGLENLGVHLWMMITVRP